ncbi:MAG TPA: hypothetical protein VHY84_15795 [Bryobacteraceae bacterium]|jgi:hypothetical protein|nr:hypothetical protein [Bryobacteraceae bacterium]
MLDIPETVIIILTVLLLFLWTRHWVLHRGVRPVETRKSKKQTSWD